jgi:hypothetical protein
MKSVLLPIIVGLVTVTGCVESNTISIQNFVLDDPNNGCMVTTSATTFQSRGLLDVGIVSVTGSDGFIAWPLIKNNLNSSLVGSTTGVEMHNIDITGVNIELQPDASIASAIPSSARKFSMQAAGGVVAPGAEVVFSVTLIPRALALSLANVVQSGVGNQLPIVTAKVSPIGDLGGSKVVGAALSFPIEICKFCLSGDIQACPATGFPAAQIQAGGCGNPAQDDPVTCCAASQSEVLCGSQVPKSTTM